MKKAKVEIVSQNVIMRSNVEVVDGKLTFPCEKVKIPEDLSKLKPVGGTEDACFVFYNKENQIIARGAIHDYYVENDLRIIWVNEREVVKNYPDEVMAIWSGWLFANTSINKVWALLTGNYPEKEFLEKNFKEEQPPKDGKNEAKSSRWYSLSKADWPK